jgi:DNA-binding CsgD family transcriptional regulator
MLLVTSTVVGREAELALIDEAISDAVAGRCRVVLCTGDGGIGKTRLAEELVVRAAGRGIVAAWGTAEETLGAPPYWPWRQVLLRIAQPVGLSVKAAELGLESTLARIAPELFGGGLVTGTESDSAAARFGVFDAVARLLSAATRDQPLVIVLDDMHRADEASLLLLSHLARRLASESMVVWVNARDSALHAVLEAVPRAAGARRLRLQGLAEEAVREQLEALAGRDFSVEDVRAVWALTSGNPFFVEEVAAGVLGRRGLGGPLDAGDVRRALAVRLESLPCDTAETLRTAAVVGREFDAAVLAVMLGRSVLADLDAAAKTGLIELAGSGWRFVHDLVRDAAEAGLGAAERPGAHRRAAETMEQLLGEVTGPQVFTLARHWSEATAEASSAVAAGWLERAAGVAATQLAFEEAAHLYREAIRAGGSEITAEDRIRLLLGGARASGRLGAYGDRLDLCLQAADAARAAGRGDLLAAAALVMEPVGEPGFGIVTRRLCQEALDGLSGDETVLRARVSARFAETFVYLPATEAADAASGAALRAAEASGDLEAIIAALAARQVVVADPGRLDERDLIARRLLELSGEGTRTEVELRGRLCAVDVALERGELAAAAGEIEAAGRCAPQVGGPVAHFLVVQARAVLAQAQGRLADARALSDDAVAAIGQAEHPARFHMRAAVLANIGRHAGQDVESLRANRCLSEPDDDEAARRAGDPGLIAALARADVLLTAGRTAEAVSAYHAVGPPSGWRVPPHVVLLTAAFGIELAAAAGAAEDLDFLRARLDAYRGHHVACGYGAAAYLGPVELWLGRAARHLDRTDEAISNFATAAAVCAANGAAGFRVEALYEQAATLAAAGRPGVQQLLKPAATRAAELGMARFTELIDELARSTGKDDSPLTRREGEIAVLVADGLTNRELAARLHLSERTVENHLQHIMVKLGLANRSQVAVWVERRK